MKNLEIFGKLCDLVGPARGNPSQFTSSQLNAFPTRAL